MSDRQSGIDINGVAHVIFTVSDWERSRPFYHKLLSFLGLNCVIDAKDKYQGGAFLYYVGGRTAIGIQQAHEQFKDRRFEQWSVGMFVLCLGIIVHFQDCIMSACVLAVKRIW
jgi:catechol 2,3-dioxygenase-like lactoylglutathione lyase family enzyme